jgi:hypothetical protein
MQWIILGIVITVAVVSAIAQAIRKGQEDQPKDEPRRRSTARSGDGVRTGTSEMDRFLQEIEKLRKRTNEGGDAQKPAAKPARAASVPTVAPKKSQRSDSIPTVAPKRGIDRLPAAKVLSQPPLTRTSSTEPTQPSQPTLPTQPTMPSAPPSPILAGQKAAPKPTTPFGENLRTLLGSPGNIATAMVMNEIFGPPKSKQK